MIEKNCLSCDSTIERCMSYPECGTGVYPNHLNAVELEKEIEALKLKLEMLKNCLIEISKQEYECGMWKQPTNEAVMAQDVLEKLGDEK